jgi:GT2 family glycosyltransferase
VNNNPLVIIPSYWTKGESTRQAASERRRHHGGAGGVDAPFAHPTALSDEHPPLLDCLNSLRGVEGLGRIAVLVAADDSAIEVRADERVRSIIEQFPELEIFVFGSTEAGSLFRRLEQLELAGMCRAFSIKSYGAVRNLGLAVAAVLGSDIVVFIDDDELVSTPDFLKKAVFGIGHPIHSGGYLFAKSGLVTDMQNNYYTDRERPWSDLFWHFDEIFNKAIQLALRPPQLHRAQFAFGGCLAVHREMYTKIAFDPWIMRGEDVDYVINARLHGGNIYLDDQWSIRHNSSGSRSAAARFRQNVYRFVYEHRKLEFAKSQVDLEQVSPASLMPFPGEFIASSISLRAFVTGILHAISGPERSDFWHVSFESLSRASLYARENCVNYFALQRMWSHTMNKLWRDVALHPLFTGERNIDRSALTGSFKPISGE